MLSLEILSIGRLKQDAEQKLQQRYLDRLQKAGPSAGLKTISVHELPESKQTTTAKRKAEEATKLIKQISPNSQIIALDETGKLQTSKSFTSALARLRDEGTQTISFILGGPDGHDQTLISAAHQTLSLSKMTLPHGLARIILLEQLYRALTIWSGHPYHRD